MKFFRSSSLPIAGIAYLVTLGFLGEYYYLFDLFSHFALQYAVAALILALIVAICRRWREVSVALAVAVFAGWRLVGADFSAILGTADADARAEVFYMNSEYLNTDIDPIVRAVERSDADIVALVELNADLYERIRATGEYQYSFYYPDLVFSFGFFSREPVLEQRTVMVGRYPIGYFRTAERTYYVVHPLPPMDAETARLQHEFFGKLEDMMTAEKGDFLVVGDFNSTISSPVFRKHFAPYFHRSVYSWGVSTPLAIPIDHALSRQPLQVRAGPRLSSDHAPLLIDMD
jgi:endonuclease/exonuclease/phosphatase (EEP) superfamily protein YafD